MSYLHNKKNTYFLLRISHLGIRLLYTIFSSNIIEILCFRKWNKVETIAMVTDAVHDVAFAPNLGRSYHLLGIATKTLKVISIDPLRYV